MSLTRRYSAAVLAASVLLLGACGGDTAPTNSTPNTPETGDNPRIISLTPETMSFESEDNTVPAPQVLAVSGLVAIGSAVQFGTEAYDQAVVPWLRISSTPVFQRDPLAWLHTVSIDPAAYAALEDGFYTATVPVIVVAALNSPQMLTVSLCKEAGGCRSLRLGDVKVEEFTTDDPRWDRGEDIDDFNPLDHPFHDWRLFVEPGQTVYVQMIGSSYSECDETGPLGTMSDPYLYQFETNGDFEDRDDDSCGYASEIEVTNNGPDVMEWLIRATTYAEVDDHDPPDYSVYGTYTIRVVAQEFYFNTVRFEPTFEEAAKAAARKNRTTP